MPPTYDYGMAELPLTIHPGDMLIRSWSWDVEIPVGWHHLEDLPGREQLAYRVADGTEVSEDGILVYEKLFREGAPDISWASIPEA